MDSGNWAKTLLFTLIGFGLGWAICCLTCGRCGGDDYRGGSFSQEQSCHAGASQGGHRGTCCSSKSNGSERVQVIVADLEKAGFQGDTTIAIEDGSIHVMRAGDSTTVRVEVSKEEMHEHAH